MNLHRVASSVIAAVNKSIPVTVQLSSGYTTRADGKRTPDYYPPITGVPAQIQALSFSDLHQLDGLNLQGIKRKIYLDGRIDGLVRPNKKGGDLITTPDGSTWLVVLVLEYWLDWCAVAVVQQNDTIPITGGPP